MDDKKNARMIEEEGLISIDTPQQDENSRNELIKSLEQMVDKPKGKSYYQKKKEKKKDEQEVVEIKEKIEEPCVTFEEQKIEEQTEIVVEQSNSTEILEKVLNVFMFSYCTPTVVANYYSLKLPLEFTEDFIILSNPFFQKTLSENILNKKLLQVKYKEEVGTTIKLDLSMPNLITISKVPYEKWMDLEKKTIESQFEKKLLKAYREIGEELVKKTTIVSQQPQQVVQTNISQHPVDDFRSSIQNKI